MLYQSVRKKKHHNNKKHHATGVKLYRVVEGLRECRTRHRKLYEIWYLFIYFFFNSQNTIVFYYYKSSLSRNQCAHTLPHPSGSFQACKTDKYGWLPAAKVYPSFYWCDIIMLSIREHVWFEFQKKKKKITS